MVHVSLEDSGPGRLELSARYTRLDVLSRSPCISFRSSTQVTSVPFEQLTVTWFCGSGFVGDARRVVDDSYLRENGMEVE